MPSGKITRILLFKLQVASKAEENVPSEVMAVAASSPNGIPPSAKRLFSPQKR
jgi:hypothetical protein